MKYTLSDILHDPSLVARVLNRLYRLKNQMGLFLPVERNLNSETNKIFKKHSAEDFKLMLNGAVFPIDVLAFGRKDRDLILKAAESAVCSEIEILGGKVELKQVDWTTDYKCGYHWENKYYTQYKTTRFGTEEDVKTVWELSRCHFLLWMAEAYQFTGDEKYAKNVVLLISDWIDKNPYCRSINWTCAMEVAIRSVNWMCAVRWISNSAAVDKPFLKKLINSLYQHGCFIYNNLENKFRFSANHYVSDLVGLLWLGSLFRNTSKGRKWYAYALPAYLDEVRSQVLPSGVHYERSISYHRLTCELFLYSYLAIKTKEPNIKLSNDINCRLQSMVEFVARYIKPSGMAPLFGDNDNGRLLPFVPRDYRDHFDILLVYNTYFKKSIQNIQESHLYADAGFAILKNRNIYLMFSNTGVSRYSDVFWDTRKIGTHTHQDALSFELTVGNSDFVIDAGTSVYTSSKVLRDEFRSTTKHNTLSVNGRSQYEFCKDDYFSVIGKYRESESINYVSNDECETVSSSFIWHISDLEEIKHERSLTVFVDKLLIEDCVNALNVHEYEWNFFLDPDVCVENRGEHILMTGTEGECMMFTCHGEKKVFINIEMDTVSPSYGIILPTKKIKCKVRASSIRVKFIFSNNLLDSSPQLKINQL